MQEGEDFYTELSSEDALILLKMLENPSEPNEKLKALFNKNKLEQGTPDTVYIDSTNDNEDI